MTEKKLLSLKEVASILNMNTEVLRRWLRNGKLPGVKVGSDWRVNSADLEKFFISSNSSTSGNSTTENSKKMCYRFPKWLEFSGLPKFLNEKIGLEAWPVFKKLVELDFELGKPLDRQIIIEPSELSERIGYPVERIKSILAALEKSGYIKIHYTDSSCCYNVITPLRTPKLVLDISYEKGGVKGAPAHALTNNCLRRFLEPTDLDE